IRKTASFLRLFRPFFDAKTTVVSAYQPLEKCMLSASRSFAIKRFEPSNNHHNVFPVLDRVANVAAFGPLVAHLDPFKPNQGQSSQRSPVQ
ncbi:MAG: hypothetical protein NTW03_01385, partial [Verrucomicrobia bacterium]|nr:hypothetical protein [Verrucomicrobiota bacterium]